MAKNQHYIYIKAGATAGDGSFASPFATVIDAVTHANNIGLGEEDIVNVLIVGDGAVIWGTGDSAIQTPEHTFKLVISPESPLFQGKITSSLNVNLGGDTDFKNIDFTVGMLRFNGFNVFQDENSKFTTANGVFLGHNNAVGIVYKGQTVNLQGIISRTIYCSSMYSKALHTAPTNLIVKNPDKKELYIYLASTNTNTMFESSLNINIENACNVHLKRSENAIFDNGGSFQFIFPTGTNITEGIENIHTTNKWILVGAPGNEIANSIEFTSLAGQFKTKNGYVVTFTDEYGYEAKTRGYIVLKPGQHLFDTVNEKCFCHFDGFAVKDAVARDYISKLDNPLKLHVLSSKETQDISLLQVGDKNILIDSGSSAEAEEHIKALKELGVEKIDYVYITHYHYDHVGGLVPISGAIDFSGATIFLPELPPKATYDDLQESVTHIDNTLNLITEYSMVPIYPNPNNHVFNIEGLTFDFKNLEPSKKYYNPDGTIATHYNDTSMCCVVSYGGVKFGFFGDIFLDAQIRLTGEIGHLDLMSVEHHGRNSGHYRPFFDSIAPKMCFTQDGDGIAEVYKDDGTLSYDYHILAERSKTQAYLQENGIPNYSTGKNGTITFNIFKFGITTNASAVKYAINLKGASSVMGAINNSAPGINQTSNPITLLALLKNMEHGTILSTKIEKANGTGTNKIWQSLLNGLVESDVSSAQLIANKGGSAIFNQSEETDSGYIIIIPHSSNRLSGLIFTHWYTTNNYQSVKFILKPLTNTEHFKFLKKNGGKTVISGAHNTDLLSIDGLKIKLPSGATCSMNFTAYFRNLTNDKITVKYWDGDGEETVSVPANGGITVPNYTILSDGEYIAFPDNSDLYVKFSGYVTYALNKSVTITETEDVAELPGTFNQYPEF